MTARVKAAGRPSQPSPAIKRFTDRSLFVYSFQQGQDLSALLVLNKRPPQAG